MNPIDPFQTSAGSSTRATVPSFERQAWSVGALCLAITDALQARFNPVRVRGELSSLTRAASGHWYFTLKDAQGQLRGAMFKRAASSVTFQPADGQQVEVSGRLGVYEQRGDLQLVVESMTRVGQGTLLEEFLRLKEKLATEGLFDAARKRPLTQHPRGIGAVTSSNAAAWHDVMTALQRRTPNVPLVLSPALVQGANAAQDMSAALRRLYAWIEDGLVKLDVILLVRGGGSIEDLWAFNDENLARTIAQSPVPVVSGVGHETDFSIADFVADVRAPTPTAAAELCAIPALEAASQLAYRAECLQSVAQSALARQGQQLDMWTRRLMQPSDQLQGQTSRLNQCASRLQHAFGKRLQQQQHVLLQSRAALELLHPQQVLNRGFAWVSDSAGAVVRDAGHLIPKQALRIHLAKGAAFVQVQSVD
jgi:exodeoxyribonuclease VII large subunit